MSQGVGTYAFLLMRYASNKQKIATALMDGG